jgi:hypothetical protein
MALRTADSGYLTRRLVDVAQDVIIRDEDCGTTEGIWVEDIMEGKEMIEKLADRILGRYAAADVIHPETGEILVENGKMINESMVDAITEAGITRVYVRSVLNCKCRHGVCAHCYGADLASGKKVNIGEAVGIIAAQSIGEPGTQLTMRTFHTGGIAGGDITQGLPRVEELFEARSPKKASILADFDGEVRIDDSKKNRHVIVTGVDGTEKSYLIPYGLRIIVEDGQAVVRGQALTEGLRKPTDIIRIDGTPFTDLPAVMNLPILNHFAINNNPNLAGKVLPAEWNTPELVYCNFAACGLTGTIPAGFAETTPKMHTAFINTNYFYGAWPHTWAAGVNGGSGILECFISANVNNKAAANQEKLPIFQDDKGSENDGMGYMVPATLDVKLNKYNNDDPSQGHANPSRDLTQMKLGGAFTLQYVGFEKGWGQERYVKFGEGNADDTATWNIHRLLVDEQAWYFSNMGYTDMCMPIPQVMMDWDQAAADAYTAEAKTKYGK